MLAPTTCRSPRADGSPCRSPVVLASGYCHLHDPDRTESSRAARSRGGKGKARLARAERLVPERLRPLLDSLLAAVEETRLGTLDPRTASAMSALAGAICRVYSAGVVEQQLADLQAQFDALTPAGPNTNRRAA
jgi:hypothetical protein